MFSIVELIGFYLPQKVETIQVVLCNKGFFQATKKSFFADCPFQSARTWAQQKVKVQLIKYTFWTIVKYDW